MATRLVLYAPVIRSYIGGHAEQLAGTAATEVALAAKLMAPHKSGALAGSIHVDGPHLRGMTATAKVGSELSYALTAHQGSRPHEEDPEGGRKVMYLGPDGFAAYVHHPGTRGVEYLTDPLRRIGRRLGFIVTDV